LKFTAEVLSFVYEFPESELVNLYQEGDYLLIDDYQKGHFFTYFLEAEPKKVFLQRFKELSN